MVDDAQTESPPAIGPRELAPEMTIVFVAMDTGQPEVPCVYEITAVPTASPLIIPVADTLATAPLDELHTPPGTALNSVSVVPKQTRESPVIAPTMTGLAGVPWNS